METLSALITMLEKILLLTNQKWKLYYMLKRLEWIRHTEGDERECYVCGATEEKHKPDCELAALLKEINA